MATWVAGAPPLAIQQALSDLNADFCYYLDHGMVAELIELFTEDAVYSHGQRVSCGKGEIRALFATRAAGVRTSRHLQTGLRITVQGTEQAEGRSVCLTFASDGPPPITPATPFLVADFIDQYRLAADGRWRIAKRHIERIFAASDNAGPVGMPGHLPPAKV